MEKDKNNKPLGYSYEAIQAVLKRILSIKELNEILIISGGIVPWIISGVDSGRLHGDIDIICKQKDMDIVRDKLKEYGVYNELMDSMYYHSEDGLDYGVDAIISGVSIGFYPYEVKTVKKIDDDGRFVDTDMIVQRSFTPPFIDGKLSGDKNDKPELKVREMPGLLESDYCSVDIVDGMTIRHSPIELIKATKQRLTRMNSRREKDLKDIEQIDKIGIDPEKQARIYKALTFMRSTLEDKTKRSIGLNTSIEKDE